MNIVIKDIGEGVKKVIINDPKTYHKLLQFAQNCDNFIGIVTF